MPHCRTLPSSQRAHSLSHAARQTCQTPTAQRPKKKQEARLSSEEGVFVPCKIRSNPTPTDLLVSSAHKGMTHGFWWSNKIHPDDSIDEEELSPSRRSSEEGQEQMRPESRRLSLKSLRTLLIAKIVPVHSPAGLKQGGLGLER
jgi:hypothetical protein